LTAVKPNATLQRVTSASERRRPRASKGEGDRLRGEIVSAAAALLARMGSDEALSLRSVARAVGVSAPSVYLHFADKDDLLVAVATDLFDDLRHTLDAAAAEAGEDPVAAVLARGQAYVAWGLAHPGHYKVLYEGVLMRRLPAPGLKAFGRPALQAIAGDLGRAAAAGRLGLADEPEELARLLWQVVHGMTSLRINKPGIDWGDPQTDVARLLTRVLGLA
jgi:AcrR family transcriptional regulator